MSTSIDTLKAAWLALIEARYAADGDALRHADALVDLDALAAALAAQAASVGTDIQSYSIAGRTVTRAPHGNVGTAVRELRLRLERYCGRGVAVLDDFNTGRLVS